MANATPREGACQDQIAEEPRRIAKHRVPPRYLRLLADSLDMNEGGLLVFLLGWRVAGEGIGRRLV